MSETRSRRYKGLSLDQLATLSVVEARQQNGARVGRACGLAAQPAQLASRAATRRKSALTAGLLLCVTGSALIILIPRSNSDAPDHTASSAQLSKLPEPLTRRPAPVSESRPAARPGPSAAPAVSFASDPEQRFSQVQALLTAGTYLERKAAYAELLKCPELPQRVGQLIRGTNGEALLCHVRAAAELELDAACAALIERLDECASSDAKLRREILSALGALRCPQSQRFLLSAVQGAEQMLPRFVWPSIGRHMADELRAYALRLAAAGDELAADALVRFARTPSACPELCAELRAALDDATTAGKRALARIVGALRPDQAGVFPFDLALTGEPPVRAAVMGALYHNPAYRYIVVSALQHDPDHSVKAACIEALMDRPPPEALPALISLLNTPALRVLAHKALVRAAHGDDFGWRDFEWRAWQQRRRLRAAEASNLDRKTNK